MFKNLLSPRAKKDDDDDDAAKDGSSSGGVFDSLVSPRKGDAHSGGEATKEAEAANAARAGESRDVLRDRHGVAWPLHRAAWRRDLKALKKACEKHKSYGDVEGVASLKDAHGNTPLHIAAHFCWLEGCKALVDAGAEVNVISDAGWTPYDEAIASGARGVAAFLYCENNKRMKREAEAQADEVSAMFEALPDFYMELEWRINSYIPLVSRLAPHDTYKIWKVGHKMRTDMSLLGMKGLSPVIGDLSWIYTGRSGNGHTMIVDRQQKTLQDVHECLGAVTEDDLKNVLDFQLSHDLCSHSFDWSAMRFKPDKEMFSKKQVEEKIGGYDAKVFKSKGFNFRSFVRSDPDAKKTRIPRAQVADDALQKYFDDKYELYFSISPTVEPAKKEKKHHHHHHTKKTEEARKKDADDKAKEGGDAADLAASGSATSTAGDGDAAGEAAKKFVSPVERAACYKAFEAGLVWPNEQLKEDSKSFQGLVHLTEQWPVISVTDLSTIAAVMAPSSTFQDKLKQFVGIKMPVDGFPVRGKIPAFVVFYATIEFQNFKLLDDGAKSKEAAVQAERSATLAADVRTKHKNIETAKIDSDELFHLPTDYEKSTKMWVDAEMREMMKAVKEEK